MPNPIHNKKSDPLKRVAFVAKELAAGRPKADPKQVGYPLQDQEPWCRRRSAMYMACRRKGKGNGFRECGAVVGPNVNDVRIEARVSSQDQDKGGRAGRGGNTDKSDAECDPGNRDAGEWEQVPCNVSLPA